MSDLSHDLAERVSEAAATDTALYIVGGDSKRHLWGRDCRGSELNVAQHSGVVDYQPGELVITARAGTPLTELAAVLGAENQWLPCECPEFDGRATLGGTLATNSNGPGRAFAGALRDLVLGVRLIDGRGRLLNFGGKVMKNVAGYDVSRLQAGALGTLGILCDITFKILPRPETTTTLIFEQAHHSAPAFIAKHARQAKPLSAACWYDGRVYLRLSGAEQAVHHTASLWGGDTLDHAATFWQQLRELSLPRLEQTEELVRLSVKPTADSLLESPPLCIDWAGGLRWYAGRDGREALQQAALAAGGHAVFYRGGDRRAEVRQPLGPAQQQIQHRLKQAFDPCGILNRGRLYSWM